MRLVRNPSYKHSPELIREFSKHKDSISYKDHTQYTDELLIVALETVIECKRLGFSSKHILWLTKQIYENKLTKDIVKDDFLPLIKFHFNNQDLLKPIGSYSSVSELNTDIESLSEESETVSEKELDIFFEKDGWILAMPHTTKASCLLGKGTDWCTSRTKSQNLFLNYVGKFDSNIVLFYVIKTNGNPVKNPDDKLSIGFQDSEPFFEDENGNITVNAANIGLNLKRFEEILGKNLAQEMLMKMYEKVKSIKAKHPAKKEMERIAKSINKYIDKISEFKNEGELDDFKKELFKFDLSEEMQMYILQNESISHIRILAKNPSIVESVQILLSNRSATKKSLSENTGLTEFVQIKLIKENLTKEEGLEIMENLASNISLTEKAQLLIAKSEDWRILGGLAENINIFKSVQMKLANSKEIQVVEYLSKNPALEEEVQMKIYRKGENRLELAENRNLAESVQLKLAKDKKAEVKNKLAQNKNITEATQLLLIENDYYEEYYPVKHELARNPSLSEFAQIKLANDEDCEVLLQLAENVLYEKVQFMLANNEVNYVRETLTKNSELTEKVQTKLADDENIKVRNNLAKNSKLFKSVQMKLCKDEEEVRLSLSNNQNLDEKTQIKLADDILEIRLNLAGKYKINDSVAKKLIDNSSDKVKARLARNITISESIQIILASDKSPTVRKALSQNRFITSRARNILDKEPIDMLAKELEQD